MDMLTCDFCGFNGPNITKLTSAELYFCDTSECYTKYINFTNGDYSHGVPYSISVKTQNIHCDFCGKKDKVKKYNALRDVCSKLDKDKRLHSNFCEEGPCAHNYSMFIYNKDLSKDLPYSIDIRIPKRDCANPKPLQCAYCGKTNKRVIYNPWTPNHLKYATFCKNKTCYKNFFNYCTNKVPKKPYVFEMRGKKKPSPILSPAEKRKGIKK
jgi:hypothetical protein